MTHRLNTALLILLLVIGMPAYWLWYDNRPGDAGPPHLSLAEVRQIAASGSGEPPHRVAVHVGRRWRSASNKIAGGSGLQPRLLADLTFRLDAPGHAPFFVGAPLAGHAVLSLDEPGSAKPYALRRGIVDLPVRGGRMIYVRLADGRELVFAGRVAPLEISLIDNRIRPRILTDWLEPEDRAEAFAMLATLRQWHREAPAMVIVPGMDPLFLQDPTRRDLFAPMSDKQHTGKP